MRERCIIVSLASPSNLAIDVTSVRLTVTPLTRTVSISRDISILQMSMNVRLGLVIEPHGLRVASVVSV